MLSESKGQPVAKEEGEEKESACIVEIHFEHVIYVGLEARHVEGMIDLPVKKVDKGPKETQDQPQEKVA